MLDQLTTNPLAFLFWAIGLIVAITVHEFAHAYAAERLGDPTPRLMGRLTLNPLAHLDPLGTLMLLIAHFGWGKPVPFDPFNLRNPQRDSAIISLAGPTSNAITAFFAALIIQLLIRIGAPFIVIIPLAYIVVLNILLGVFNLIPIHPLDGFKIVGGLLPASQAREWYQLERYGIFFLLMVIVPFGGVSIISRMLGPIINTLLPLFLPAPLVSFFT